MAIRAAVLAAGHTCFAINLTRHRRTEADGLFYPAHPLEVLRLILRLRPDIIHLHVGGDLTLRLAGLNAVCAALPFARTVFTFHSGGFPSSPAGQAITPRSLRAILLRQAHRLIAVNPDIEQFFFRCGARRQQVRVISPYSAVPPHPGPLPEPVESFVAAHDPLLMTIGLLEPEYDLALQIDFLGDVLAQHPGAGLLIAGSGSLEAELRARIAEKPYASRILLYGDLEHSRTLAALARARVFLRTTLYDGDALSVREAITLGIPVIATRTALRPSGIELIPTSDRPALTRAVLAELARPFTRPQTRDTPDDRNIQAVLDLYSEALNPRAQTQPA